MPRFPFKISTISVVLMIILYLQGGDLLNFTMLLSALALHEISHLVVINAYGYKISELKFTPFGGSLKIDPLFEVNPEAEFFISLSGPFINWAMVGGVAYLRLLGIESLFLSSWMRYNFLIGFINLIPAFPLDGGRILHAWLNRHIGFEAAFVWSKIVSALAAIGFIWLALVKIVHHTGGTFYLLIGLFILFHCFTEKSPRLSLFWRLWQRKKMLLAQKGHLPVKSIAVTPGTFLREALTHYTSDHYLQFVIFDQGKFVGSIIEDKTWEILMDHGFKATFLETMRTKDSGNLQNTSR